MANTQRAFTLPVVDTITIAWNKVSGSKGCFWAAIGILLLIMFGLGLVESALGQPLAGLFGLVASIINILLQVGLIYIGILRAFDKPIHYQLLFSKFNTQTAITLIGLYLLKFLIFLIPVMLAGTAIVLANQMPVAGTLLGLIAFATIIYLSIRLFVALAYVLDKGAGPIEAIKLSFAATRDHVFAMLGIYFIQFVIFIIATIPLGIGLIWAIPLGLILYGTVYKRLSENN